MIAMKTMLKISIVLNLVLAGGLVFMLHQKPVADAELRVVAETPPPMTLPAATAPQNPIQAEPKPFRWIDLLSTNGYWDYVANLRAAGCPAPTIRDIVNGDVARVYSSQRRRLGLDGSGNGAWSLKQETQLVARLLGRPGEREPANAEAASVPNPGASQAADATVASPKADAPTASGGAGSSAQNAPSTQPEMNAAGTVAPRYPLALQLPDTALNDPALNASQKAAIQQVQQQFTKDVGGPNQNPADPAYLANWQTAQNNADQALRGILGDDAYNAYEQQIYYNNFKQLLINSGGKPLTFNPVELAR